MMDFMEKRRGKGSRRGRREVIFFCSLLVSALIGLFWHDRQSGLKDDIALTFFFFFVFSLSSFSQGRVIVLFEY